MQTADKVPTEQQIKDTFADARGGPLATLGNGPDPSFSQGDMTVITARRVEVKRQHEDIMEEIRVLAKVAGPAWWYSLPASNEDGTKANIEGPTVKCTDEVARIYGNCAQQTRTEDRPDSWMITARFVDHERGYLIERQYVQMKPGFDGRKPSRMATRERVLQIGISKATRNVVHHALRTYVDFAFDEAKESFVATIGRNLERYREKTLQRLQELGVDIKRVERAQGRVNTEWRAQDVAKIVAQIQSIQDGMMTIDDTWPRTEGEGEPRPTREDSRQESANVGDQAKGTEQSDQDRVLQEDQAAAEGDYHIADAVGEIQTFQFGMEQEAFGALFKWVMAAGKANDWKAVGTLRENNESALTIWKEHGRSDLADQILQVIAMFTPPSNTASAPSRDGPERSAGAAQSQPPAERIPSKRTTRKATAQAEPVAAPGGSEPNRRTEDRPADPPTQSSDTQAGTVAANEATGQENGAASPESTGKDGPSSRDGNGPIATSDASRSEEELRVRSEYWSRERLTIEIPKKPNNTYNFQLLRDRLAYVGEEAMTEDEIIRFEADNQEPMRILAEAFPNYALLVREIWHKQSEKIAERGA